MNNIPGGYDENGVRAGRGKFMDVCPECGSEDVWRNASDEMMCDNCGYEEVDEDIPESEMESFNARYFDKEKDGWSEWVRVEVEK